MRAAESVQGVHAAGGAEQGAAGSWHPPRQRRAGAELTGVVAAAADAAVTICMLSPSGGSGRRTYGVCTRACAQCTSLHAGTISAGAAPRQPLCCGPVDTRLFQEPSGCAHCAALK